jgi:uncharacterized membrane protein (DUF373 family)
LLCSVIAKVQQSLALGKRKITAWRRGQGEESGWAAAKYNAEVSMQRESRRQSRLVALIRHCERVVHYGVALALIITLGMLFYATAATILDVIAAGVLPTALIVLDQILLIFILAELLSTVATIVREDEVNAEPFLLIGLIAVVRRVLTVTAEIEQSLGTPEFESLIYELAVLTVLIIALSGALYFIRRSERIIRRGGHRPNSETAE